MPSNYIINKNILNNYRYDVKIKGAYLAIVQQNNKKEHKFINLRNQHEPIYVIELNVKEYTDPKALFIKLFEAFDSEAYVLALYDLKTVGNSNILNSIPVPKIFVKSLF
jgi:hypothetical protein